MDDLRLFPRCALCSIVLWLAGCGGYHSGGGAPDASAGGQSSSGGALAASSASSASGGSDTGGGSSAGTTAANLAGSSGESGGMAGGSTASSPSSASTGGGRTTGGSRSTASSRTASGGSSARSVDAGGGSDASLGRDAGAGEVAPDGARGEDGARSDGPAVSCTVTDWGSPPAGDSKWIDESWAAQLSSNVKGRTEWLLDSAIQGKGQINICVRWGATTAPNAELKTNIGSWVEKWFNNWFKGLDGYGCFPYSHITAKVTGWAVRKGNESWVADLDSSTTKVYTDVETGSTPPNEPKCADACSFFTLDGKGKHDFPKCPGGEAFHFDYSMWLDDKIPESGAAAVGGDWGLRMPAGDFMALKGAPSSVVEHEMGHGFGFQDYYDWTQDRPSDGSLMIVGSSNAQTPTQADFWLLRRTWKEMKTLRGW